MQVMARIYILVNPIIPGTGTVMLLAFVKSLPHITPHVTSQLMELNNKYTPHTTPPQHHTDELIRDTY